MKEKLHETTIDYNSINKIASKYSSEAILIINKQGQIIYASDSAERILGVKKKPIINLPIFEFPWAKEILNQHILNQSKIPISISPHRFQIKDKNKKYRWLELNYHEYLESPVKEKKLIIQIRDITDFHVSESSLNENAKKYKNLLSNTDLGIMEVDNEENILFVNHGFERISGYKSKELVGKKAPAVFLEEKKQKDINIQQRLNRRHGNEGFYELKIKIKNGIQRHWIISGTPIYDNKGNINGSIGIHWDITNSRTMEAKILFEKIQKEKQLIENQLQAEEKQREKIGRDLHDGVGQMLVYLSLHLKLIKEKKSIRKSDLEKTEKTIQQIINEIRNLSKDFAAPTIKELGLKDAVIELIGTFSILTNPNFKLSVYKGPDPEPMIYEQKIMMYRIIQELCSNTFKHANASQVEIELIKNKNELCLKYKDNGIGFDPQKNYEGIGLKGILSRIEYYGGQLLLKSKDEKGLEVLINLPIN